MKKYMAQIVIAGKAAIVFPRTKKTHFFATCQKAAQALERRALKCAFDTRGLVYEFTPDGAKALVLTIAL